MKLVVFGAGQLAKMMYLAAAPLGVEVQAVDVKTRLMVHPVSKAGLNVKLQDAFAEAIAISAEFEHVPEDLLEMAEQTGKLLPNSKAILSGADRIREKQLLDLAGVANAEFTIIDDITKLDECVEKLGERIIFKASRDGYDGYGQWRINQASQLSEIKKIFTTLDLKTVPIIAEKMIDFSRELSIIGARNAKGQTNIYDLAENLHHHGQLHVSIAPAPNISEEVRVQAVNAFENIANKLEYVGVLAVEMFQIEDELLVNEIAPRVHNSGHWTQNGAETCQFEQHVRAVLNFALGDTSTNKATLMINIIGCTSFSRDLISIPGCHLHWYGKEVREKRKMGHINITGSDYKDLSEKLALLQNYLPSEYFPKLQSQVERLKSFQ